MHSPTRRALGLHPVRHGALILAPSLCWLVPRQPPSAPINCPVARTVGSTSSATQAGTNIEIAKSHLPGRTEACNHAPSGPVGLATPPKQTGYLPSPRSRGNTQHYL